MTGLLLCLVMFAAPVAILVASRQSPVLMVPEFGEPKPSNIRRSPLAIPMPRGSAMTAAMKQHTHDSLDALPKSVVPYAAAVLRDK